MTPAPAPYGPPAGTMICGKYRVERVLGRGGMGYVVEATHVQLQLKVAIKGMLSHLATSEEAAQRFLREARIAAALTNPHVVRVLDVDVDEAAGGPFMAMELLEGTSLDALLRDGQVLAPADAARYAIEVCEGLAEAHAKGIVHRDLKPANLFLVRQWGGGSVLKILDFGISKVASANTGLTRDDAYMGSPSFMSPEQMMSTKTVDRRADIWSLGVCLYRFVTGMLPFDSTNPWEISARVLQHEPPAPHVVRRDVPIELSRIVQRCLCKSVSERFGSVDEVRAALESIMGAFSRDGAAPLSTGIGVPPRTIAPATDPDPAILDATEPSLFPPVEPTLSSHRDLPMSASAPTRRAPRTQRIDFLPPAPPVFPANGGTHGPVSAESVAVSRARSGWLGGALVALVATVTIVAIVGLGLRSGSGTATGAAPPPAAMTGVAVASALPPPIAPDDINLVPPAPVVPTGPKKAPSGSSARPPYRFTAPVQFSGGR